ncbi:MAG: tRNA dihydrouridine synthase DusB [Planctomycetota bacterium]|jgi:nifR3 family TIM-barrel protein
MPGLSIGNLKLRQPVLQSPMAGCSDLAYRRIARRFGCELAFCEMVKDRPVTERHRRTMAFLESPDWDRPIGMQLVGREPARMADAARVLEGRGAQVVDVNLGCPVRKVVRDGCGAALLQEPEQVGRIVERMAAAVKVPVTIKMRIGFAHEPDGAFLEVAKTAEKAGAAAMTVHGRTRLQKFAGMSNHDAIRAVKEAVSVPVIGNGDIRRGPDAVRMMEQTGCDGVMVARGALGNPWIYREVVECLEGRPCPPRPALPERADVIREHLRLMRELHGDRKAFVLIRRVIHWYLKDIPGGPRLRGRANHIQSEQDFESVVQTFESL